MNETTIGLLVLCAAGVGFFMWQNSATKVKKAEEFEGARLYRELLNLETSEGVITPEIAREVITFLPVLETDIARDLWRETLSDHIIDFLELDGSFTSAEE